MTEIWAANFLKKKLALLVTRYHGQQSSCAITQKINDLLLRKFGDRWMDRLIEGKTDGQIDRQRQIRVIS